MRFIATISLICVAALPTAADAKGCIKGAAVGGVAGHFVGKGHALAGAAVGCAVGHHRAAVAAKRAAAEKKAQAHAG